MLTGRSNELQYLNTEFNRSGSRLLVVYGQRHIGKTTLLLDFIKGKTAFYHLCVPASAREQLFLLSDCLKQKGMTLPEYPFYSDVFSALLERVKPGEKMVLVFDEWEHMLYEDHSFMDELLKVLHHAYSPDDVMIILCSSSIGFVENHMVGKIGKAAYEISGFLKIKELHFTDMIQCFSKSTMTEIVTAYSVLGGVPGLWGYFEQDKTTEQNICDHILKNGALLQEEGGRFVKEELRETPVYDTILAAIAQGKCKLNDIYKHTGFSRAKISVYLKNLMQLEIVEKVFSLDTPGKDNQRVGIYRISNTFVHFWFRYLYPHLGALQELPPRKYYDTYIRPTFLSYCDTYFSDICTEYMLLCDEKKALPFSVTRNGIFDGKLGRIDFIGQNDEGRTICAFSDFAKPLVSFDDYKKYLAVIAQARLKPDYIYLFSGGRFDEKLSQEAKAKGNITLIGMDDL